MNSGDSFHRATCSIGMRFQSKDIDHATRLLLSVRESIRAKRDCHACEVWIDPREAGLIHYREEWEFCEAFLRHVRSDEFRRILFALDLSCEEPRIVIGNLSGLTGLSHLLEIRNAGGRPDTDRDGWQAAGRPGYPAAAGKLIPFARFSGRPRAGSAE